MGGEFGYFEYLVFFPIGTLGELEIRGWFLELLLFGFGLGRLLLLGFCGFFRSGLLCMCNLYLLCNFLFKYLYDLSNSNHPKEQQKTYPLH